MLKKTTFFYPWSPVDKLCLSWRTWLTLTFSIASAYFCFCPAKAASETDLQDEEGRKIRYIGNRQTYKLHRLTCPYRLVMRAELEKKFVCRAAAIQESFIPCRYCLPPVWKSVRGRVMLQKNDYPMEAAKEKN